MVPAHDLQVPTARNSRNLLQNSVFFRGRELIFGLISCSLWSGSLIFWKGDGHGRTNLPHVAIQPPQLKYDLLLLVDLGEVELVVVESLLQVEHGLRGPPLRGAPGVVLEDETVAALQQTGLGRSFEVVSEVPKFHVLFPRCLKLPVELCELDGVGYPRDSWNLKPIRPIISSNRSLASPRCCERISSHLKFEVSVREEELPNLGRRHLGTGMELSP